MERPKWLLVVTVSALTALSTVGLAQTRVQPAEIQHGGLMPQKKNNQIPPDTWQIGASGGATSPAKWAPFNAWFKNFKDEKPIVVGGMLPYKVDIYRNVDGASEDTGPIGDMIKFCVPVATKTPNVKIGSSWKVIWLDCYSGTITEPNPNVPDGTYHPLINEIELDGCFVSRTKTYGATATSRGYEIITITPTKVVFRARVNGQMAVVKTEDFLKPKVGS